MINVINVKKLADLRNIANKFHILLVLICLMTITSMVYFMRNGFSLDAAVEDGDVEDAWDYPVMDDSFNNTLGTGIKVAIVDTGIDWQHPDFFRPDFSKIYDIEIEENFPYIDFDADNVRDGNENSVINQTSIYKNGTNYVSTGVDPKIDYGYNDSNSNGKYDFGETICYYIDIDNDGQVDSGDKAIQLGESKIEIIRDYSTGKWFKSGVNLTNPSLNDEADTNGHGTHIAGIIAAGWPVIRNITGIAPNCTLLVYKVVDQIDRWFSDKVVQGIYDAVNDGAQVISLSYAEYFKNMTLDGSGVEGGGSIVEDAIDWAYSQGVPVVVAAGNFGNKWVHMEFDTTIFPATPFDIPYTAEGYDGCRELEFLNVWTEPNALIGINITLPNRTGPVPITIPDSSLGGPNWNGIQQLDPSGQFWVLRERYNANFNGVNKSYMKIWRADGWPISTAEIISGNYIIINSTIINQKVHVYINSKYETSPEVWFSGYPGAYWQPMGGYFYTIASPATANHCITVGSFISTDTKPLDEFPLGDKSDFSSVGPRVDGVRQMDIIAPGEVILSTASRNDTKPYKFGQGNYTTMSGTSMAAPYVAGVIALAMENNYRLIGNPSLIESYLQQTANTDAYTNAYGIGYDDITGYGKINAYQMLFNSTYIPPSEEENDKDDKHGGKKEALIIPGYNSLLLIGSIGIISIIIIKAKHNKLNNSK